MVEKKLKSKNKGEFIELSFLKNIVVKTVLIKKYDDAFELNGCNYEIYYFKLKHNILLQVGKYY